jgi:hypothetical protein
MGIEPTSEAWEARNLTQKTLDWRQFCNFRSALNGKWQLDSWRLSSPLAKRILFQNTCHQAKWRSKRSRAQPPKHLLRPPVHFRA